MTQRTVIVVLLPVPLLFLPVHGKYLQPAAGCFSTTTDAHNSSKSFGISGGLNLGFASIGGGYGKSTSETSTSSGGFSSTYDYNHTGVRQSNINALDSAMNKHVQQSNSMRQIDVNTSTRGTSSRHDVQAIYSWLARKGL